MEWKGAAATAAAIILSLRGWRQQARREVFCIQKNPKNQEEDVLKWNSYDQKEFLKLKNMIAEIKIELKYNNRNLLQNRIKRKEGKCEEKYKDRNSIQAV